MLLFVALWYNLVAVIIAVTAGPIDNVAAPLIFAIAYVLVGIPGAWVMWYQRLYKGMISDGAVSFAAFFCVFMIHIAFCIWSALAPELGNVKGTGHAGLLPAIDFLKGSGADKVVGASVANAAFGAAVSQMCICTLAPCIVQAWFHVRRCGWLCFPLT